MTFSKDFSAVERRRRSQLFLFSFFSPERIGWCSSFIVYCRKLSHSVCNLFFSRLNKFSFCNCDSRILSVAFDQYVCESTYPSIPKETKSCHLNRMNTYLEVGIMLILVKHFGLGILSIYWPSAQFYVLNSVKNCSIHCDKIYEASDLRQCISIQSTVNQSRRKSTKKKFRKKENVWYYGWSRRL